MEEKQLIDKLRTIYLKSSKPKGRMIKALVEQYQVKKISQDFFLATAERFVNNNKELLGE